ncbi:hypothetical protein [Candidatus Erwinia haradaeae]|nr:hypothetical protein [Candidatus Erwinia haradaeae]
MNWISIDLNQGVYVLSHESQVDLFTLQTKCRKKNLPDSLEEWGR